MKRCRILLAVAAALVVAGQVAWAAPPAVGSKAPDFKLQGSDGKEYSLADFAGKKAVVIAWFPKAFTGGCTAECKSMKESGDAVRKMRVRNFAASVDTPELNAKFAASLDLDYPILSDVTKDVARA